MDLKYNIKYICAKYFGSYVCRYADCVNQGFLDYKDNMRITCPYCRKYLGLPQLHREVF